jgi:preprotein translocase subunit SecE
VAELIHGMLTASRYKRSQGRIARQLTFAAIAAIFVIAAWRWSSGSSGTWLRGFMSPVLAEATAKYILPTALVALGAWIAFRIVNIPKFADFLISVEAEMNKVSWPSRGELYRASLVVIVVIFLLTAILFTYDFLLKLGVGWLLGGG